MCPQVSAFIVLAKEQVKQQSYFQQQQQAAACSGRLDSSFVPLIPGGTRSGGLVAPLYSGVISQPQEQYGLVTLDERQLQTIPLPFTTQQQLQNSKQPTVVPQHIGSVAAGSPLTTSSNGSPMLLTNTAAQQLLVVPANGSCERTISHVFVPAAQEQVVQQQQQLAQMQAPQLHMLSSSSQPVQLSVQPQVISSVGLSAAAASPLQQHSLQQQLQSLGLSLALQPTDQAVQYDQLQMASVDTSTANAGFVANSTTAGPYIGVALDNTASMIDLSNCNVMQSCTGAYTVAPAASTPGHQPHSLLPAQQQLLYRAVTNIGSDSNGSSRTWSPVLPSGYIPVTASAATAAAPSLLSNQDQRVQAVMMSHMMAGTNLTASPAHSSSSGASNISRCYSCALTQAMY